MRQKFTFEIDPKKGLLKLTEAAESDPGTFLVVHGETYNLEEMTTAAGQGQEPFIEALRRRNLFPPLDLATKIFEKVSEFLSEAPAEPLVVDYEDIEFIPLLEDLEEDEEDEEDEEEALKVDDLLEAPVEDVSDDEIKEIDSDDDTPKFKPEDVSEHEN